MFPVEISVHSQSTT